MNSIDFHSNIAKEFAQKYQKNKNLKQRAELWEKLIFQFLPKEGLVLDAGCGPGQISEAVKEKTNCSLIGVDGSDEMIQLCRERFQQASHFSFEKTTLPHGLKKLETNHFQGILSSSVLEYIPEYEIQLQEFYRLLTPDGKLILSVPNKNSLFRVLERFSFKLIKKPHYLNFAINQFSKNSICKILQQIGFEITHLEYDGYIPVYSMLVKPFIPQHLESPLIVIVAKKSPTP